MFAVNALLPRLCCCFFEDDADDGIPLSNMQPVILDSSKVGLECVILKGGRRLCGAGAALANAPLVQNKSYFEVKIQTTGTWGVGLATQKCHLDRVPLGGDMSSWVLRSDGNVCHDGEVIYTTSPKPDEGDVVSCTYDHIELNFFLNGKSLQCPVSGVRGRVFPVFYVGDGAILDVAFKDFSFPAPDTFDEIMFEQNIL
ncbi:SPRY domain-containing protein 7-like [Sycon ciliatum]|uniref:SPRY domain-containing protein 7-like n=1 Tax=Sycon ciliatum TaxID=27933 RepID=UPI0020AA708C|eukprot:scpid84444/ scgid15153/ SPRY domain-containing protein 7; Chronic lymphocytic leukemia deletion region gene 6 protein